MCGITGKYYFDSQREVDLNVIDAMTDVMSHRGPDDRGLFREKNVALGHRRLSILDLSTAGHQPMSNENGTVWVVFNGEIYDYKRLRSDLWSRGHVFHSTTDTEVIVHAYEEYGTDCVQHFDGMFAFAIWDSPNRRLLLARDHFGIKPLYYFQSPEFISFASEIKSILTDPEVPKAVDEQALSNFLTLHYVPAPRTMFAGIRKLLPGHMMVIERGKVSEQRYWELRPQQVGERKESDVAEGVYDQLRHSVAQRLQSDVPVGALLSGGLDSSAVLGLMTDVAQQPVPAFSVGYSHDGNDGFSEFHYARMVAKHFQSDYHEVVVTPKMFLDFLPKAVWYQDEPIGEPASVPLYFVCKLAKDNGITVLLSGEGSDELFAGYNRHIGEEISRYYRFVPEPVHRSAAWLFARLPRTPVLRKGHQAMALRDFWQRYQSWHTVCSNDLKRHLLSGDQGLADSFSDVFAAYPSPEGLDNLRKLMWLDIKVWLPDDLLMKKDRMGMATSVEARVPFLDHRFAEAAFSLPSHLKVRGLTGKYIFKKAMERILPREIIYRKKAGFPTPISRWIAEDLRHPLTEILCPPASSDHGYFDRTVVKHLLGEHTSGRENHERLLFPILNFDVWYQTFFQHTFACAPASTSIPTIA